jgi:hypothetical protein
MEPVRLRAMLARHISACLPAGLPLGTPLSHDLVPRLLSLPLPAASRTWLEQPDNHLIRSDLR